MTVKCFTGPVFLSNTILLLYGAAKKLVSDTHVQNYGVVRIPATPTMAAPVSRSSSATCSLLTGWWIAYVDGSAAHAKKVVVLDLVVKIVVVEQNKSTASTDRCNVQTTGSLMTLSWRKQLSDWTVLAKNTTKCLQEPTDSQHRMQAAAWRIKEGTTASALSLLVDEPLLPHIHHWVLGANPEMFFVNEYLRTRITLSVLW